MRKILVKFEAVLVVLTLLLSLTSLFGCERNREYDEGEVIDAARELIEKSQLLNEIYYGKGIPATTDSSTASGYYFEADIRYLMEHDFRTIDDLREMTSAVFTENMCNLIFTTKLSSINDGDNTQSLARYYQKYSDAEGREPECIMVYTRAISLLKGETIYDLSTLRVDGVKGQVITVALEVNLFNEEGDSQTATLKVDLLEEKNGFRLDSPTYKVYNGKLDEYNELQGK